MMNSKYDTVISCDPGLSNGAFAIFRNGHTECKAISKLKTISGITTVLKCYKEISDNMIMFIEKTSTLPPSMYKEEPFRVIQMNKLLKHHANLIAILTVLEIPFIEVHSRKWQSYLNLVVKGEGQKDRKNRYKSFAQKCYPELRATLVNSDALCLLQYGRLKLVREPGEILILLRNRN